MEDILPELCKARVFSKLDLTSGYLHCVLDHESSQLTTMITPFGRFRWCRLPFGLNVSSEIFQKRLLQQIANLPGIACVADDIIVYGVGDTRSEADVNHDIRLRNLLKRCRERKIKLNKEKIEMTTDRIHFFGNIISSKGLEVDEDKVQAILKMASPTCKVEVQRLLGAVNYLSKFLPRLSDIMKPLRQLTHDNVD